jgi:hypothetical protein
MLEERPLIFRIGDDVNHGHLKPDESSVLFLLLFFIKPMNISNMAYKRGLANGAIPCLWLMSPPFRLGRNLCPSVDCEPHCESPLHLLY